MGTAEEAASRTGEKSFEIQGPMGKLYAVMRQPDIETKGKVALLGNSQGGVVASMVAGELGKKNISAVVLMAPAAVLRGDAIRGNTKGKTYDPLNPPEYVDLGNNLKLGRDYITTAFSLPIYETAAKYHGFTQDLKKATDIAADWLISKL
jgi:pimeloyl-ACP methyl ester carboxylesterase